MSVDAVFARTGLKSVSKLHTSTFFDGKLEMDNGKLMKAELNVPKDTVDVLDVSVDFFTLQNDELKEIQSKNEVRKASHNLCLASHVSRNTAIEMATLLFVNVHIP